MADANEAPRAAGAQGQRVEPDDIFVSDENTIINPRLERSLLWRLDILLVPITCILYLLAFLDRSNIGNARIAGLQADLKISDTQYQTAITVTYVFYIASELPSNLIMRKVGPRYVLPVICLLWGVTASVQARVNTYSQLLAARCFLGLFEGGILPGIIYCLSSFYRPHELHLRVGLMFSGTSLSGAFSGLLAAAIAPMEGDRGLHGWQWIFLLEGVFTVCFAIAAFFLIPSTPAKIITLNPELTAYNIRRLRIDNRDDPEPITVRKVLSVGQEPHLWAMFLVLFCNGVTLFGLANFTPSIVATFGFGTARTQLMTVPPFALAFVFTVASAIISDRYRCRGATASVMNLFAIIGFALFVGGTRTAVRYVGLCFAIVGAYTQAPCYCVWVPNNIAGRTRRATAIAISFVFTNSGGIVSTWIYPRKDQPLYRFAAKFNLALSCISVGLLILAIVLLEWKNRLKVKRREELLAKVKELPSEEQFDVLGDHHPDFKYTL